MTAGDNEAGTAGGGDGGLIRTHVGWPVLLPLREFIAGACGLGAVVA